MATAAPSPPPPCSKRTPTRFHRRAGTLSPLCSTGSLDIVQPRLAKQVAAKIATAPNQMLLLLLLLSCLGESVVELSGQVGILPSQLYLQPLSLLAGNTFPVARGIRRPPLC